MTVGSGAVTTGTDGSGGLMGNRYLFYFLAGISMTAIWPGADFQEREVYDLFGVKFVGHPDLRRILLEDRFPGHPLRKDWTFDYEYILVRHLKYGAEGQDGPAGGEEGFRRV